MAIEFLDPDEQALGHLPVESIGGDGRQRPRLELDRDAVVAVVLLVGAGVLAVLASFQTVSTESQPSTGIGSEGVSVDAWGRYHTVGQQSVTSGIHDPRYGIPLCVCAGIFALAALVLGAAMLRGRSPRAGTAAALAAAASVCGLAGVTVTMWLQIDATFDSLHASLRGLDAEVVSRLHLGVGASLWTSLAAVVAGLLAGYACLRLRACWAEPPPG